MQLSNILKPIKYCFMQNRIMSSTNITKRAAGSARGGGNVLHVIYVCLIIVSNILFSDGSPPCLPKAIPLDLSEVASQEREAASHLTSCFHVNCDAFSDQV